MKNKGVAYRRSKYEAILRRCRVLKEEKVMVIQQLHQKNITYRANRNHQLKFPKDYFPSTVIRCRCNTTHKP